MAIPNLDARGLLPDGIHEADLQEIRAQFCTNDCRRRLWEQFLRFIAELRTRGLDVAELIVAGSFFSDKPNPEDIEATIVTGSDVGVIGVAMLLQLEHGRIKEQFGVDYYPTLPGQNDFTAYFRYVGPKTAKAKRLRPKDRRGIVRVMSWANG